MLPTLVSELTGKFITRVEAGESSFALNDDGDLYVWGFYNQQVYKKPFIPSTFPCPINDVT